MRKDTVGGRQPLLRRHREGVARRDLKPAGDTSPRTTGEEDVDAHRCLPIPLATPPRWHHTLLEHPRAGAILAPGVEGS